MSRSIDFLHPPSPPLVGWVLLAIGAAALAAALIVDRHYVTAIAEQEAATQTRLDEARRLARPAFAVSPTSAELRLRQASLDAHQPWLATLRSIEATTQAPVFLRSLVIEPAAGVVKLEAEASTFADVLAYVKALDEAELLRPAFLNSHEQIIDATTGKSVVRFQVATRWNAR